VQSFEVLMNFKFRFGLYWDRNRPAIFLRDLDLIKQVQVGEFEHFTDLAFNHPEYLAKVGNAFGIADMQGDQWKKMKRMLTPPFSVPRLNKTVPSMNIAAEKLRDYLKTTENEEFVDAVDFTKKFYMTTVASVLFGMDINCYGEEESEFEKKGKNLLSVPRFIIKDLFPSLAILFKIKFIDPDSERFFTNLCKQMVRERKKLNLEVKDVLGNLMHVAEENPDMTEEMMYKTCVQFFTDGYETASLAISVLIYHLARNREIQERIQEEIDDIFENKNEDDHVDEKDLKDMPYLDQVRIYHISSKKCVFFTKFFLQRFSQKA
jgi:cytochrome P450